MAVGIEDRTGRHLKNPVNLKWFTILLSLGLDTNVCRTKSEWASQAVGENSVMQWHAWESRNATNKRYTHTAEHIKSRKEVRKTEGAIHPWAAFRNGNEKPRARKRRHSDNGVEMTVKGANGRSAQNWASAAAWLRQPQSWMKPSQSRKYENSSTKTCREVWSLSRQRKSKV